MNHWETWAYYQRNGLTVTKLADLLQMAYGKNDPEKHTEAAEYLIPFLNAYRRT